MRGSRPQGRTGYYVFTMGMWPQWATEPTERPRYTPRARATATRLRTVQRYPTAHASTTCRLPTSTDHAAQPPRRHQPDTARAPAGHTVRQRPRCSHSPYSTATPPTLELARSGHRYVGARTLPVLRRFPAHRDCGFDSAAHSSHRRGVRRSQTNPERPTATAARRLRMNANDTSF